MKGPQSPRPAQPGERQDRTGQEPRAAPRPPPARGRTSSVLDREARFARGPAAMLRSRRVLRRRPQRRSRIAPGSLALPAARGLLPPQCHPAQKRLQARLPRPKSGSPPAPNTAESGRRPEPRRSRRRRCHHPRRCSATSDAARTPRPLLHLIGRGLLDMRPTAPRASLRLRQHRSIMTAITPETCGSAFGWRSAPVEALHWDPWGMY